ncbi:hypothetical protein KKA14_10460 [bacterium]|nr:hypothetical protein [bacterium]
MESDNLSQDKTVQRMYSSLQEQDIVSILNTNFPSVGILRIKIDREDGRVEIVVSEKVDEIKKYLNMRMPIGFKLYVFPEFAS